MAIGIVSDEEFFGELDKLSGNKESFPIVKESHKRGRSEGDNNVPESLRKIIGEESVINGRESALEIAREFGVSASSVSAYAKGATSTATYNAPSKRLIDYINKSRARHVKKASSVLNAALGAISQEKLDYTEAKDLAGIAKDMAVIIKNLEPQSPGPEKQETNNQFVIYAPSFRKEESFEVIDVRE